MTYFPQGSPWLLLSHIRVHSRLPSRGTFMTIRSTMCRLQSRNLCRERGHRSETLLGQPLSPSSTPISHSSDWGDRQALVSVLARKAPLRGSFPLPKG